MEQLRNEFENTAFLRLFSTLVSGSGPGVVTPLDYWASRTARLQVFLGQVPFEIVEAFQHYIFVGFVGRSAFNLRRCLELNPFPAVSRCRARPV